MKGTEGIAFSYRTRLGGLSVVEGYAFGEEGWNVKKRYYTAYGSNLYIHQMISRCPNARLVGTANLEDWRLVYRKSKTGYYATIEPAEDFTVPVAVWEMTEADEAMLDRYEGVPFYYHKVELMLDIKGIKSGKYRRRRTFAYVMRMDAPIGVPTYRYMRTCINGYRQFGFDCSILDEAYDYSEQMMLDEKAACRKTPFSQAMEKWKIGCGSGFFPRTVTFERSEK